MPTASTAWPFADRFTGPNPTRPDAAIATEPSEQSFHLIATLVHLFVVLPWFDAALQRRHDGDEAQIESELACLIALVGAVHQQVQGPIRRSETSQQCPAFRGVVCLAGRQRERYGCARVSCDHMNLGVPSAARLADGLGSVFLRAPVPSGCTLMLVLSSDTDSMLMRTI